jgi:hypothetical protein
MQIPPPAAPDKGRPAAPVNQPTNRLHRLADASRWPAPHTDEFFENFIIFSRNYIRFIYTYFSGAYETRHDSRPKTVVAVTAT